MFSFSTVVRALLCVLLVAGIAAADVEFDNVDDVITATATCNDLLTASSATMMGWIKVIGAGTYASECFFDSTIFRDTDRLVGLGRRSSTLYCFEVFDGASKQITSASSSGWHHLAWTLSGGTLTAYVDGVSAGTLASGNQQCTTGTLRMGENMVDRLAGLMTFNTALSAGEIANIAGSRIFGPVRTQPSADWRLTDCADAASGDAVSFKDRSGNGRNISGDNGANNTGLTCKGSEFLKYGE